MNIRKEDRRKLNLKRKAWLSIRPAFVGWRWSQLSRPAKPRRGVHFPAAAAMSAEKRLASSYKYSSEAWKGFCFAENSPPPLLKKKVLMPP
nr:hypothetical protein Itr_chr15CG14500 [Ipomoea trifida]